MKKHPLLYIQGASYALTAIFILSLPFWADVSDDDGNLFAVLIALAFGLLAFIKFRKIRQASEVEQAYEPAELAPPEDATEEELAAYYKRLLLFLWLALLALTAIVVWALNDLETGALETVRVWAPIAFLYAHFGYWIAVLSAPLLGIILSVVLLWSWRKRLKQMPKTLFAIGYWYSEHQPYFCKPHALVDASWDEREKQAVIAHIQQAEDVTFYRGFSGCRFCNKPNGTTDKSDGLFCFPEGFAHYLEVHQVKPPQLFIDFALGKDVRRLLRQEAQQARGAFRGPSSYQESFEKHCVDFSWWVIINHRENED